MARKKEDDLKINKVYVTKTIKLTIGNPVKLNGKRYRVTEIHWGGFTLREGA